MKILVNTKQELFEHDYDFSTKKGKSKLKYSNNPNWSNHIRGQVAMTAEDDGNGVQISTPTHNIYLGYSELQQLQLLLSLIEKPSFQLK